jgi:hypothetical protein
MGSGESKRKRDWAQEVFPYVKEELEKFKQEGIVPTLRTIFYRLASRNIIRNVQNDYTYLSDFTTRCRKRHVFLDRLKIESGREYELDEDLKRRLQSYQLLTQYKRKRHF